MSTPALLSKAPSTSWDFLSLGSIASLQCWLGLKCTRDYPILSSNLTLGTWRFNSHNASNMTPYVNRDPIRFQYDHIMSSWDLCGPSNCLDLYPLTLLKGGHLFNGTYFDIKRPVKMWTGAIPVTTGRQIGWKAAPVCVWPPFFFLVTNISFVRDKQP